MRKQVLATSEIHYLEEGTRKTRSDRAWNTTSVNSMRQTSKVITRDNVGKRRHCSHLAPELHAPAGRNARKWSERSTKDGGSPYQKHHV